MMLKCLIVMHSQPIVADLLHKGRRKCIQIFHQNRVSDFGEILIKIRKFGCNQICHLRGHQNEFDENIRILEFHS